MYLPYQYDGLTRHAVIKREAMNEYADGSVMLIYKMPLAASPNRYSVILT